MTIEQRKVIDYPRLTNETLKLYSVNEYGELIMWIEMITDHSIYGITTVVRTEAYNKFGELVRSTYYPNILTPNYNADVKGW